MKIYPDKMDVAQLKRSKEWIVWGGMPWPDTRFCGPYKTRKEAQGAIRGIRKAIQNTKES